MKAILKSYYRDGRFIDLKEEKELGQDKEIKDQASATYDVLRVMGGRPLFLEAHIERLNDCLRALAYPVRQDIPQILEALIRRNGGASINCNVKILAGGDYDLVMGFIESFYPEPALYERGVALTAVQMERPDPGHKIWRADYKRDMARLVSERGAFEALLVNRQGLVTEGSKSNVFFIREGRFLTPATGALPGVTKRYVEETMASQGLILDRTEVPSKELDSMEGAFLTGTSLNILPVSSLDDLAYRPDHPLLGKLRAAFSRTISDHLGLEIS